MSERRRWLDGLVVFTILALSVGLAIRWTGVEERLRGLSEQPWWDWVPWLLLIVFWAVIIRVVRKRASGG